MLNIVYNDIICIFNIVFPCGISNIIFLYGISGTYGDNLQVQTMYDTMETLKLLEEGFT
jgi:hypothetical protein